MHDYVVTQLQERTETYAEISEGSGVSKRTIEKIARREIADPSVSFIERLASYFRKRSGKKAN